MAIDHGPQDSRIVERAEVEEDKEHGQQETDIAHPVGYERFRAGDGGHISLEPETNQRRRNRNPHLPNPGS